MPTSSSGPDVESTDDAPKRRRTYLPATERRRLILEAAQQVFARSNLQGARTRDIAKAADVNQATLFQHFESKEELFHEAVVQPLIEELRGMHERVKLYRTAGTIEEAVTLAQANTERHFRSMVKIFPLFTAAMFSDLELGRRLYVDHIAPLFGEHGDIISSVVKEDLDPELVGVASFGLFFAVAMDRVFRDKLDDIPELSRQLAELTIASFGRYQHKD